MFRIGQKVVQIKRTPWASLMWGEIAPSFGNVLTVRTISTDRRGETYLRFVEIVNPRLGYPETDSDGLDEARFLANHFRPVVERKTDISIFTSMLNPSPVVVDSFRIADHAREIVG